MPALMEFQHSLPVLVGKPVFQIEEPISQAANIAFVAEKLISQAGKIAFEVEAPAWKQNDWAVVQMYYY